MILSILSYGIPIFLAAVAGYLTDISGKMNIALEGLILLAAFVSFLVLDSLHSFTAAAAAAILAAGAVSYALYSMTEGLKANIFITGLALNLIIPGTASLLSERIYGTGGVLPVSLVQTISYSRLTITWSLLAALIFFTASSIMGKTRAGLLLKASGLNSRALEIRGGSPQRIRSLAFLASGMLCGLAGAYLTFSVRAFVPNISSGKGWIGLAAVYLGSRRLSGIVYAVLFFSAAEMLANAAQGAFDLPSSLFLGFPYAVTLAGLILQHLIADLRRKQKTR